MHQSSDRNSDLVLGQLRGLKLPSPGVISDRRARRERRRLTLWSVLYGGIHPRRRRVRRNLDGTVPVVDWHETHLFAVAIAILLLCCADAFLTLNLLVLGATEANPLMNTLIYEDVTVFASVKMGLTGMGVLVLVFLSRYRMFGRLRVVTTLYSALVIYTALVAYELVLLFYLS